MGARTAAGKDFFVVSDQSPSDVTAELPAAEHHGGVRADLAERLVRRAGRRWTLVILGAAMFAVAVYLLAVQTVTGQTLENAAFLGADQADPEQHLLGVDNMRIVTLSHFAAANLVVAAIGLLRRQPFLAAVGVSIVVVGQVVTQTLKHFVLPRPELALIATRHMENTLPSGHTTVAMTLLFALLVVVPYRYRGVVMFFALTWAVGMGAYTIAARAHRLSDTLAADAVALLVACSFSLLIARTGRLRAVISPGAARYTLRTVFVVVVAVAGAAALASGTVLMIVGWQDGAFDAAGQWNLYLGVHALALAGSAITALVFWWTWHRLEAKRRDDPIVVG